MIALSSYLDGGQSAQMVGFRRIVRTNVPNITAVAMRIITQPNIGINEIVLTSRNSRKETPTRRLLCHLYPFLLLNKLARNTASIALLNMASRKMMVNNTTPIGMPIKEATSRNIPNGTNTISAMHRPETSMKPLKKALLRAS